MVDQAGKQLCQLLDTVSPATGTYGVTPVTFTISSPGLTAGPAVVTIEDISYSTLTSNVSVAIPPRYIVGQKNLGSGLSDVYTPITPAPSVDWVNDSAARELRLSSSPATAQVVETESVDLSTVGDVLVTAKFVPSETSAGSNFETVDKFKIELVYTEGASTITKNLVTEHDASLPLNQHWDVGDGASSLTVATLGANGAPDGWINGYVGAAGTNAGPSATVYATGLDDYNDNRGRDEFNRLGEAGIIELNHPEVATNAGVAFSMDFTYTIPASADSAKLVITGVGVGGTELFLVKDVLFALAPVGPVDTDSDGMTDAYETANGLDPNSAADKLTDLDGDGQSNYAEFLAGTKANDPSETLKVLDIVPTATAGLYDVSVSTVVGKKYQLQESSDLGQTDTWANLGAPVTATATTTTFQVSITGLGVRHFVRAEVVP